jgi:hypothetical protein
VYYQGTQPDAGARQKDFSGGGGPATTNSLYVATNPPSNVLNDADYPDAPAALFSVYRSQVLVGGELVDNTFGDCPFTFTVSSPDGAVEDTDYTVATLSGTIPNGQHFVNVTAVRPKRNPAYTEQRVVEATLEPGAAYELSGLIVATLNLFDSDLPPGVIIRPQPAPGHGILTPPL